uniref:Thioredoxin n=1 Tax=Magnetococcus massalia (strain MO-1) TaxID=451514 RepID=A0A1S7LFJ8_MAGMO|nr:Thioredoxin [Candidatus Magnetococcus massalia]
MAVTELTKDNFQDTISGNDIVIVDFWATWCGPCKAFAPIYEKVSEQFPDVAFAKVNTDEERELAMEFQIRSIPTLMIFRENIIIFSQPGMLPEQALIEILGKAKELDMDEVRKEVEAQAGQQEA